jgi:hypothetical protein
MKKSKLTLGMTVAVMSCALLAGCDANKVTYSPEGYLLTYTDADGNVQHYSAEDLFGSYIKDSTKVSTMFDGIYKLIVRNYFNAEAKKGDYEQIKKNAQNDVEGVKSKAKENQKTNDSKYDDEWKALLESYSCKDEDELLEHFIYERELKEFNDQFYKEHIAELRDDKEADNEFKFSGYLEKKVPYHVRHILTKIEDSGSTNYWNATIDKKDALDLYDVASALASGTQTFGKVAQLYSEDTSSTSFGELEIVDKDTEYVPEFKLGMYAFENLFSQNTAAAATSKIAMGDTIKNEYTEATSTTIGQIPYGVFTKLRDVNDITKDSLNRDVNDGNANYFPRNIYFNHYLNNHYVSVVTPYDLEGTEITDLGGFSDTGDGLGKILRTTEGQPILVVRAGASSYQGIHFIVIERSGLVQTQGNVTLSEYYTTKRPSEDGYPKDEEGHAKQTYVNYLAQSEADYKKRAETVENKIKNFDSNLNKHIYQMNVKAQNIVFTEKGKAIQEAIDKWILTTTTKAAFDESINWEKTWESYLDSLRSAKEEKAKVISQTCAIQFQDATKGDEWKVGGACYDNKEK